MKRIDSHFLEFPMTLKELENWETKGAAVLHKGSLVFNFIFNFRSNIIRGGREQPNLIYLRNF